MASRSRCLQAFTFGCLPLWASIALAAGPTAEDYFVIRVVDVDAGRGVPLVELKTTSEVLYYTDSNGIVAFYEPGLMGQEVFFHVKSHGYEFPADFLGFRGEKLRVVPGGSATLKIKRLNVAERLYRITGEGVYRDSVLVGYPVPIKNPVLNGQVTGQDSVMAVPYRGRIYWFWGDTGRPSYPLGHFGTAGATSGVPGHGGLDPSVGVDLTYFVDASGFSKPMCDWPAPGMKWITGIMTLQDPQGAERLLAKYGSFKNLGESFEDGLIIFDDRKEIFERLLVFVPGTPLMPGGTPFRVRISGIEYLYFDEPYSVPCVRVRADWSHVTDATAYEGFTSLITGAKYEKAETRLDRASDGTLRYGWKPATKPLDYGQQKELVASKQMEAGEGLLQQLDFESGQAITAGGSVTWNAFRRRWVMIGRGDFPDVWYSEADTPVGPWVYARKVVTHDRYTFYNVRHHTFFDQDRGRLIYFEGTYTDYFSDAPMRTPRYNYNQIMYRLDLSDPRTFLPVPVYRVKREDGAVRYLAREQVDAEHCWDQIEAIPFFAFMPDRRLPELIPIYAWVEGKDTVLRRNPQKDSRAGASPTFYALPVEANLPTAPEAPLTGRWRCKAKADGEENWSLTFELDLKREGDSVRGTLGTYEIRGGHFADGQVTLSVQTEDGIFHLTGRLKQGRLVGDWKAQKEASNGTWEAERLDPANTAFTSPAVVSLYEYGTRDKSRHLYLTDPALNDPTWHRSTEPLCRVWRNPMCLLLVDRGAKPVSNPN